MEVQIYLRRRGSGNVFRGASGDQTVEIAYNDRKSLTMQVKYLDEHRKRLDLVRVAYLDRFTIRRRALLDLLDTENKYCQAQRAYVNGEYDLRVGPAVKEADYCTLEVPKGSVE